MIYFSAPNLQPNFTPRQQHTDGLEHVQIWISAFRKCKWAVKQQLSMKLKISNILSTVRLLSAVFESVWMPS